MSPNRSNPSNWWRVYDASLSKRTGIERVRVVLFLLVAFFGFTEVANGQDSGALDSQVHMMELDPVVTIAVAAQWVVAQTTTQSVLTRAQREIEKEDLAQAQRLLSQSLSTDPTNQEIRFLLARVLGWRGKFDEALLNYEHLLADAEDNPDYLLGKATILYWQGQPEKATPILQSARVAAPNYLDVWQLEIRTLLAAGESEFARELLADAEARFGVAELTELRQIIQDQDALTTYTEIEIGGRHDDLDGPRASWTSAYVDLSHRFRSGTTLYGGARVTDRFGLEDEQFRGGVYYRVAPRWLTQLEVEVSPSHEVLARWSAFASMGYEIAPGWNLSVGIRHSEYTEPSVDIVTAKLERYWSSFRGDYTLYASSLEDEDFIYSHVGVLDYYYANRSYSGVFGSIGKEADFVDANTLISRGTNSAGVRGQHWLHSQWAVTYTLARYELEDAFDRYGIHLGLRHRF